MKILCHKALLQNYMALLYRWNANYAALYIKALRKMEYLPGRRPYSSQVYRFSSKETKRIAYAKTKSQRLRSRFCAFVFAARNRTIPLLLKSETFQASSLLL